MRLGSSAVLALLLLAACDGREESAIDNLANGANAAQFENNSRAEAQPVLEPLNPPAPGMPAGLPVDPQPGGGEASIDPKAPQGAADRRRVGWGKRVAGGVDSGGRGILQKKTIKK